MTEILFNIITLIILVLIGLSFVLLIVNLILDIIDRKAQRKEFSEINNLMIKKLKEEVENKDE